MQGTGASRTVPALRSHQKARISFDLHGCVTWMSMPLTALEPLDRSSQPARSVVLDDLRLQVDRVEHRSLAGCSLHNLGSRQQAAAGPRWRGGSARIESANELSCSERATMRCACTDRVNDVCASCHPRLSDGWDDQHELVATGACARIGGGDDAHSSRTSRSSRLARAHEARITARLYGRRPAGSAQEQHGS